MLEGRLAVGAYPGKKHSGFHEPVPEVISELLDADIDVFINLTQDYPGGSDEHLTRYDDFLGRTVTVERFPIPDVSTPNIELMEEILDSIDTYLSQGRTVYVHCWGGIGRAGTTIGCWLIRHGYAAGDEVFEVLAELRRGNRGAGHRMSPETFEQCEFVLAWPLRQPSRNERVVACLMGGAVGDALGAGIEFMTLSDIVEEYGDKGVTEIVPAYGKPAAITDDTQMTLFTAEGLIEAALNNANPTDSVWEAYLRWFHTQGGPLPNNTDPDNGLLAVPDLHNCRAPGLTCTGSLRGGKPGTRTKPVNSSKGCGGVMRAAPAGLIANDAVDAYKLGCDIAALTHGHPTAWVAAGTLAATIYQLTQGVSPVEAVQTGLYLAKHDRADNDVAQSLVQAVRAAGKGELVAADIEQLGAGWTGEEALAIAVACFLTDISPQRQLLLAVNHSGDSDSTGSILGNLLGAAHGFAAIPKKWRKQVELGEVVTAVATELANV